MEKIICDYICFITQVAFFWGRPNPQGLCVHITRTGDLGSDSLQCSSSFNGSDTYLGFIIFSTVVALLHLSMHVARNSSAAVEKQTGEVICPWSHYKSTASSPVDNTACPLPSILPFSLLFCKTKQSKSLPSSPCCFWLFVKGERVIPGLLLPYGHQHRSCLEGGL